MWSHRTDGLPGAHHPWRGPDGHRRHRRRPRQRSAQEPRVARVRRGGAADSPALQAGEPRGAARGDRDSGGRCADRRPGDRGDGRALLGRVARPGARGRGESQSRGRAHPPRRRLQTAHVALLVPGAGGGGAQVPRRGQARDGTSRRHRGHGARQGGAGRPVLGHPPDRRAQHPELLPAPPRGRDEAARAAQARHGHLDPGMAPVRRVPPLRRQRERDPVRAGHPHLRDRDTLHPGSQRRARGEEALAPAGGRGPEPRHGALGIRGVHGPGGRGGGRGRADHRGAPAARGGAVGRTPVAQARPICRADRPRSARRPGSGPRSLTAIIGGGGSDSEGSAASGPAPAGPPKESPREAPTAAAPKVAAVPPAPGEPVPDIRSLSRGPGGAGGSGEGWAGIEGDPIPLDTKDNRYSDYLLRVRRMITAKWVYPCVRNASTSECEYKSAKLVIVFGILKDGRVPRVDVAEHSNYEIYDDVAVRAIQLASPFPPVPAELMTAAPAGSAGIRIVASFHYILESSLTNILRLRTGNVSRRARLLDTPRQRRVASAVPLVSSLL